MSFESAANTVDSAVEAAAAVEQEMQDHLYGIQALARLLQKASESLDDQFTGIYGTALIMEQKANRVLEMIGQA